MSVVVFLLFWHTAAAAAAKVGVSNREPWKRAEGQHSQKDYLKQFYERDVFKLK